MRPLLTPPLPPPEAINESTSSHKKAQSVCGSVQELQSGKASAVVVAVDIIGILVLTQRVTSIGIADLKLNALVDAGSPAEEKTTLYVPDGILIVFGKWMYNALEELVNKAKLYDVTPMVVSYKTVLLELTSLILSGDVGVPFRKRLSVGDIPRTVASPGRTV